MLVMVSEEVEAWNVLLAAALSLGGESVGAIGILALLVFSVFLNSYGLLGASRQQQE